VRFFLGVMSLILAPITSAIACSTASCLGDGIEFTRSFDVAVKHDGKALPGVSVYITPDGVDGGAAVVSGTTSSNGSFRVKKLPPGKYWLNSQLLGVSAGSQCFHIGVQPSPSARTKLRYNWGVLAPATRAVEGTFVYGEPGLGGTGFWSFVRQVDVPVEGAVLSLRSPFDSETYSAASDSNGHFSFALVPEGLYVLHIDAGRTSGGHHYESADLPIRLGKSARSSGIVLKDTIGEFGGCGGIELTPETNPRFKNPS
jgi:hypothetical protein